MKSQRITGTASNCLIVTRFGYLEDASGVEKSIIPLRLMAFEGVAAAHIGTA